MPKELDDVAKEELKETFDVFDKDKDGFLLTTEVKKVIRATGLNPSEAEFNEMFLKAEVEPPKITFKQFVEVVENCDRKPDIEEDLIQSFLVFDELKNGLCSMEEMKSALQSFGEPLTDAEFQEFAKLAKPNLQGQIDYRNYCYTIFNSTA